MHSIQLISYSLGNLKTFRATIYTSCCVWISFECIVSLQFSIYNMFSVAYILIILHITRLRIQSRLSCARHLFILFCTRNMFVVDAGCYILVLLLCSISIVHSSEWLDPYYPYYTNWPILYKCVIVNKCIFVYIGKHKKNAIRLFSEAKVSNAFNIIDAAKLWHLSRKLAWYVYCAHRRQSLN